MKYLITTLICLMLVAVCEGQKTPLYTNYSHVIDLDKTVPEIPLSEVFESITPIVLETTKESLIGASIGKVIATPEYLIVQDFQSLFLFKRDGSFVHNFGEVNVSDFCYDNTKGTVYVLTCQMLATRKISDSFRSTAIELSKLEEDANPILFYYKFKE